MKILAKPKKWGNSLAVIIPKEVVEAEKISQEKSVEVKITTKNPVKEVFGSLKNWDIDTQKFKNKMRKEEEMSEKRKWEQNTS